MTLCLDEKGRVLAIRAGWMPAGERDEGDVLLAFVEDGDGWSYWVLSPADTLELLDKLAFCLEEAVRP
jgi:hypothetical protein